MQFESLADFIAMGGYGPYVWFCFAFTFFLLLGLTIGSVKKRSKIEQQINDAMSREQRIKQAKEADLL